MKIGVPSEIKVAERRVGLTPDAVTTLVADGHCVYIQSNAGAAIGYSDEDFQNAGAEVLSRAVDVFDQADLIIKVKEPQPSEIAMLKPHHTLFTYLHLAADKAMTEALVSTGCRAIAYETVRDQQGQLPLLAPMSQVAGRMATQVAAETLMLHRGGMGKLMGGVPGTAPARVTVLGGGVVGTEAARMAIGMGADVTIVDKSLPRLKQLDDQFNGRLKTQASVGSSVDRLIVDSDVVIGAVLIPGAVAPKLVRTSHLAKMQNGSVIVDVAIDQGGCFETSKATTHEDPTYVIDGIVHYCVANMPGAVARTSTEALVAATLPYAQAIAKDADYAMQIDKGLAQGLSVDKGQLVCPDVIAAFN